ncbi:MAG: LysR substrate-binding domain-containing protein [Coprococcus sp.]
MTIGEYAIVPSLSAFIKKHPDTDIHVRYANTQTLLSFYTREALISPLWKDILNPIISRSVFLRQKNILLWLPKNHVFQKPVHCLKDLTSERLLIREHGSGTRAILTKTLALKNMSIQNFPHIVEIENIHAIVSLLCRDCGISFLYKSAVEQEINDGRPETNCAL